MPFSTYLATATVKAYKYMPIDLGIRSYNDTRSNEINLLKLIIVINDTTCINSTSVQVYQYIINSNNKYPVNKMR